MRVWLLQTGKDMELVLCYINAHWKVTSEEEEFNNQVD